MSTSFSPSQETSIVSNGNLRPSLTISSPSSISMMDSNKERKRYEYPFSINSKSQQKNENNSLSLQLPSLEVPSIESQSHQSKESEEPQLQILSFRIPKKQNIAIHAQSNANHQNDAISINKESNSKNRNHSKRRKRPNFKHSNQSIAVNSAVPSIPSLIDSNNNNKALTPPMIAMSASTSQQMQIAKDQKQSMSIGDIMNETSSSSTSYSEPEIVKKQLKNQKKTSKKRKKQRTAFVINDDSNSSDSDSLQCQPSTQSAQKKKKTTATRRKWNEIEDIWLKWLYDSVRLKKYERKYENVNNAQFEHLPSRFPWSYCHERFNSYSSYCRCFNKQNEKVLNELSYFRSEDSIKQHLRNPLWIPHDIASRKLYCTEMGVSEESVSNECWNKMDERIKWLYRRAVLHRELLHGFINSEHYKGKCLGIRIMARSNSKSWLATYSDSKILRFDNHLQAAQGWDIEVRSNHGLMIDSNLPLSVREYLSLSDQFFNIWNIDDCELKIKWNKMKNLLIKHFMDREYGIFPNLSSLHAKLTMIYEWKNAQILAQNARLNENEKIWKIIKFESMQNIFNDDYDENDIEFEHFVVAMLMLMTKTAEISCYGFFDHFILSKLDNEKDSALNANDLMQSNDDLKFCLFDVQFDLNQILTRCFKHYIKNPFYAESVFNLNNLPKQTTKKQQQNEQNGVQKEEEKNEQNNVNLATEQQQTEFGPDNAMTLNDCMTLTDSLLSISSISLHFGDCLKQLQQKSACNEYEDVAMYLKDLNKVWDDAMALHSKSNISVFKMAKKYKALCLKKFELFFEALTDHRRRSKRLMNGCHDIRRYSQHQHQNRVNSKKLCTELSENVVKNVAIIHNDDDDTYEQKEEEEEDTDDGDEEETDVDMFEDEMDEDIDGDVDDMDMDIDDDENNDFMCPRCGTFEGKNSRSLKTHMRYCNKNDIMQYLEEQNNASPNGSQMSMNGNGNTNANAMKCECGFSSHVAKGLQSHQLTCELIKRRLNGVSIGKIAKNTKIRMWIDTQWFTGTVIEHTPNYELKLPHLYLIYFRAKGDKPLTYDLEKYNFKIVKNKRMSSTASTTSSSDDDDGGMYEKKKKKKRKKKRKKNEKKRKLNGVSVGSNGGESKRQRLSLSEHSAMCNPFFIYLHDTSSYRHELFNAQYNSFVNDAQKWMKNTKKFIKKIEKQRREM